MHWLSDGLDQALRRHVAAGDHTNGSPDSVRNSRILFLS
jgi:hypothetical protein